MPATRWNTNLFDMFDFGDQDEMSLEELVLKSGTPHVVKQNIEVTPGAQSDPIEQEFEIPSELPVLPLRGVVVYPQTAVPLTIGQPRSIRLVDDVVASDERLIALVASRDPDLEAPGPDDLYSVGTVAMIHRLFRAPDGTIRLVVQGMLRCKVDEYVQMEPYLKAKIQLHPETVDDGAEVEALARNAREQFGRIGEMIPSIPRELVTSVLALDDPLQTAYTVANFQRMELEDAQLLLEMDSVSEKLHRLAGILVREIEVLEIGFKDPKRSPLGDRKSSARVFPERAAQGNPERAG